MQWRTGKAGVRGKDIWKLVLFAAVVLSRLSLPASSGWASACRSEWIAGMGTRGMVVYVCLYVVAVVAAVPGLPISIAAAAIFGATKGVILVSIGSTLGASAAFLISRYLAVAVVQEVEGNKGTRRVIATMTAPCFSVRRSRRWNFSFPESQRLIAFGPGSGR